MAKMTIPARDAESIMRSTETDSIQELMFGSILEVDEDKPVHVDMERRRIHLYLKTSSTSGICPCCGKRSEKVHCSNFRHPQWMPINGMATFAHIELHRFRCANKSCPRKTFVEKLDNARKNQHRSDLVNIIIFAVSVFCSDIAASLICGEMGILVSHDSANRILNHVLVEDDPDIESIGVDDVSLRKGQKYHTAIYDGNDHHLLALLDGRDGSALKEWLKDHPKVSVVARDRASAYASAITEILPQAMQVADRFHILQNLLGYLNDIFKANMPQQIFIRDGQVMEQPPEKVLAPAVPLDSPEIETMHYDNSPPTDENGQEISYCNKQRNENNANYKRLAEGRKKKYERILGLRREWEKTERKNKKEFAKEHSVSVPALTRYLAMSDEDVEKVLEITEYKKKKTSMDGCLNIVYKMLSDGHKPAAIYSYILKTGYEGSIDSLVNHIKAIALNNFNIKLGRNFQLVEKYPDDVVVIRRFDVLKYIAMKDKGKLNDSNVAMYYEQIRQRYPAVKLCSEIWDGFYPILMGNDPDKIDTFLNEYENSLIAPFVDGIKKDIAPIKNAISSPVSSGFVEGGNCRYKVTKRVMFGRSGLHHLFLKTYAISIIMRQGKSASSLIENWLKN